MRDDSFSDFKSLFLKFYFFLKGEWDDSLGKNERLSSAADLGELSRRFAAANSGVDFSTTLRSRFQSPLLPKMQELKLGKIYQKIIREANLNFASS